jgi:hypothetical protein
MRRVSPSGEDAGIKQRHSGKTRGKGGIKPRGSPSGPAHHLTGIVGAIDLRGDAELVLLRALAVELDCAPILYPDVGVEPQINGVSWQERWNLAAHGEHSLRAWRIDRIGPWRHDDLYLALCEPSFITGPESSIQDKDGRCPAFRCVANRGHQVLQEREETRIGGRDDRKLRHAGTWS